MGCDIGEGERVGSVDDKHPIAIDLSGMLDERGR
jgi:hypothetical protein